VIGEVEGGSGGNRERFHDARSGVSAAGEDLHLSAAERAGVDRQPVGSDVVHLKQPVAALAELQARIGADLAGDRQRACRGRHAEDEVVLQGQRRGDGVTSGQHIDAGRRAEHL
jgi:hypothetical protein